VAHGVLNGMEAAAVVLRSETGGSGTFFDLAVVVRESGQPVNLVTMPLDDQVKIEEVTIEANVVHVTMLQADPEDPHCCPTKRVVNTYALHLVHLISQVDVAAADPIAGTAWSWQETVLNDGTQIVPEEGQYTASFGIDGLVRIPPGCNSSTRGYTVEGNQLTIQLGPTTSAYCPPPLLSDVFLRELAAAQSVRFEGDWLLIDLAMDAGTMRFAAMSSVQSQDGTRACALRT